MRNIIRRIKRDMIALIGFSCFICGDPLPLPNFGSSCYMNGLIQNLLNIPQLNDLVLNLKDVEPQGLIANYINIIKDKKNGLIQEKNLVDFYASVKNLFSSKNKSGQQDVTEFYTLLLDVIDPPNKNQQLMALLSIQQEEIISSEILNCRSPKPKSLLYYLAIGLSKTLTDDDEAVSLNTEIENYFLPETLPKETNIDCNGVDVAPGDVRKQAELTALPEVLVISPNLFGWDEKQGSSVRNNVPRVVEYSFNVRNFLDEDLKKNASKTDVQYILVGVAKHDGETNKFGHYTAYIRDISDGLWYYCNDNVISLIGKDLSESQKLDAGTNGYMLFYMQQAAFDALIQKNKQIREANEQAGALAQAFMGLV